MSNEYYDNFQNNYPNDNLMINNFASSTSTFTNNQMLLDWINTINEPLCLLVSELDDLKDGNVFIEILRHYLNEKNLGNILKRINSSVNISNPVEKIQIFLETLSQICNNKEYSAQIKKFLDNLYNLLNDNELLWQLIYFIKKFYEEGEKIGIVNKMNEQNFGNNLINEAYNVNENRNNKLNNYFKNEEVYNDGMIIENNYDYNNDNNDNDKNNNDNYNDDNYDDNDNNYKDKNDYNNNVNKNEYNNNCYEENNDYNNNNYDNSNYGNSIYEKNNYKNFNKYNNYEDNYYCNNDSSNNYSNNYYNINNNIFDKMQNKLTNNVKPQTNKILRDDINMNENNDIVHNPKQNINNKDISYINNNQIDNENIFGLNFHLDDDEDNRDIKSEILNNIPINKFNINNTKKNLYEQKIKNNRDILSNNLKTSVNVKEGPFEISTSKYNESISKNNSKKNLNKINNNANKKKLPNPNNSKNIKTKNFSHNKLVKQNKNNNNIGNSYYTEINSSKSNSSFVVNKKKNFHSNIKNHSNRTINPDNNSILNKNYSYLNNNYRDNTFVFNNNIREENYKKIYSKKQRAELDMIRGCFISDKKLFNFDLRNNINISYVKMIKTSDPILQVNYRNIQKFFPLIRKKFVNEIKSNNNLDNNSSYISNITHQNNNNQRKKSLSNLNNNNFDNKIKKMPTESKTVKQVKKKPDLNTQYEMTPNNNNNTKMTSLNNSKYFVPNTVDNFPSHLKNAIYNWLVDINIIKDKIIQVEQLPILCINGVLLCDLINRCEGRNEIIKGIIRKANNKSQIQVNINKALEYLRTIEKFPSRNLWNNNEIIKGNSKVIWELLNDIYGFYGNKLKFKKKLNKNNSFSSNKINPQKIGGDDDSHVYNFAKYNYTSENLNKNTRKKINTAVNNTNKKPPTRNKIFLDEDDFCDQQNHFVMKENIKTKMENTYDISPIKTNVQNKKFNENLNNINRKNTNYSYRNNLNLTNDNINDSKMYCLNNKHQNQKKSTSVKNDKILFNYERQNKSFTLNKTNNRKGSNSHITNSNYSFYSTNPENRTKYKGGFLLFEKSTATKLKKQIGEISRRGTNDFDTLDIKDII